MSQKIDLIPPAGSPQWWASRPKRIEKGTGRGRPAVPFDKIIDTALTIVEEVGPQAFNMRMLAERLESGTATLYRHVASKDEILAYVADRVLGKIEIAQGERGIATWQEASLMGGNAFYRLLCKYPHIAPLLASQIPLGPNGLRLREDQIALLLASGFTPELAARAYVSIGHYVLGFAIQRHAAESTAERQARKDLERFFTKLDTQEFPATSRIATQLATLSTEEEFIFGLRLIIDGLELALQRDGVSKKTKPGSGSSLDNGERRRPRPSHG